MNGRISSDWPKAPTDLHGDTTEALNSTFRRLYGANREELLAVTPLAALTLIGTGEIWRIEFGRPTKSYPAPAWLAEIKGLMHAVIGTQASWARLTRGKDVAAAQRAAIELNAAVREATQRIPAGLPGEVAPFAAAVLAQLLQLSQAWADEGRATAGDFPAALQRVQPELDEVLNIVGEAVYASVRRGLLAFAGESDPAQWAQCLVGVCGVGFGRRDNVEIAAAMSVMGRDAVGTRLLYFENACSIPEGLKVLAAAVADLELGQAVFGDRERMWRDLLGDVAARHAGGGFFPATGRG